MGEFNTAVGNLIQACPGFGATVPETFIDQKLDHSFAALFIFENLEELTPTVEVSSGIEVIKRLRCDRKVARVQAGSTIRREEKRLGKSLQKNRTDIQRAYHRDRDRLGDKFGDGDPVAHSSLSSILFRLNTGFINIIDRFTKGESTCADYLSLINLANTSRIEAINTFSQLSLRISRSQLTLQTEGSKSTPSRAGRHSSPKGKRASSSGKGFNHQAGFLKSKSAPEVSTTNTALGPATPSGWIRPKQRRNVSSTSMKPIRLHPKPRQSKSADTTRQRKFKPQSEPLSPPPRATKDPTQNLTWRKTLSTKSHVRVFKRESVISFASDSTKLGEIPEQNWSMPVSSAHNNPTAFPLNLFKEPEKAQSRFMRLLTRGLGN